jgi:Domain of unknown function (DUF4365)
MPENPSRPTPPRKRRTRQHVIEDLSRNAVERQFLLRGHTLTEPKADYGTDFLVYTFDHEGFVEGGVILLQLKATDSPRRLVDGTLAIAIEVKDFNAWMDEPMPVVLILFDAMNDVAFWQYIQAYFNEDPERRPPTGNARVTVRFPKENILNPDAVEYITGKKRSIHAQIMKGVRHAL